MIRLRLSVLPMLAAFAAGSALADAVPCPLPIATAFSQAQPGQPTVLMVLSPRMPFALQEWPRMRQAARASGFDVLALRDPRVPLDEWTDAVQAAGLPGLTGITPIDPASAARLGLLHHAPSSLVIQGGRAHPWPILGVMADAPWIGLLRQRRSQLEFAQC